MNARFWLRATAPKESQTGRPGLRAGTRVGSTAQIAVHSSGLGKREIEDAVRAEAKAGEIHAPCIAAMALERRKHERAHFVDVPMPKVPGEGQLRREYDELVLHAARIAGRERPVARERGFERRRRRLVVAVQEAKQRMGAGALRHGKEVLHRDGRVINPK